MSDVKMNKIKELLGFHPNVSDRFVYLEIMALRSIVRSPLTTVEERLILKMEEGK